MNRPRKAQLWRQRLVAAWWQAAGWVLCSALIGCAGPLAPTAPSAPSASELRQPEGSTSFTRQSGHSSQHFSVAAANPLATQAGYQMLRRGGSAIDAAIAAQMVFDAGGAAIERAGWRLLPHAFRRAPRPGF